MSNVLASATKIVLVMLSFVLSISFVYIVFANGNDHDLLTGIVSLFSAVMIAIISFYFGQKSIPSGGAVDSQTTTTTSSTPPIE